MRKSLPIAALALLVALAGLPINNEYTLSVTPNPVELGDVFNTCLDAPAPSLAFLILSDSAGPTPTKYGPLEVGFPGFIVAIPIGDKCGAVCFPHLVHCDPILVDFVAHMQFVAFSLCDPSIVGVSNAVALTIADGTCIEPGDFVTFTQGGWGTKCKGNNPGCLRDEFFADVFPTALVLGDDPSEPGDDPTTFGLVLTESAAVQAFLPEGGTPAQLGGDETDPTSSTAGVLAGQLCAATLNLEFDDFGAFDGMKTKPAVKLGDLLFADDGSNHPALVGHSVREIIQVAHAVIAREAGPTVDIDGDMIMDLGLSDLVDALDTINNCFDDGTVYDGSLELP